MNLNTTILQHLLIERELCIAKIQFVTKRLELLDEQIEEKKRVIELEKKESKL